MADSCTFALVAYPGEQIGRRCETVAVVRHDAAMLSSLLANMWRDAKDMSHVSRSLYGGCAPAESAEHHPQPCQGWDAKEYAVPIPLSVCAPERIVFVTEFMRTCCDALRVCGLQGPRGSMSRDDALRAEACERRVARAFCRNNVTVDAMGDLIRATAFLDVGCLYCELCSLAARAYCLDIATMLERRQQSDGRGDEGRRASANEALI
jgi:hypothetical protein